MGSESAIKVPGEVAMINDSTAASTILTNFSSSFLTVYPYVNCKVDAAVNLEQEEYTEVC